MEEAHGEGHEDAANQAEKQHPRTVKHLADEIRLRAIEAYGEATFARLCMRFAQNLGEGNDYVLYVLVFRLLAQPQSDLKIMQLAIVWLDGHGHGKMTLEMLGLELQRIRSGAGTRPLSPMPTPPPPSSPSSSTSVSPQPSSSPPLPPQQDQQNEVGE